MGLFSSLHVGILAAVVVLSVAGALGPRLVPGRWADVVAVAMGVVMLAAQATWWAALIRDPALVRSHGIPLEICDTNVLVTAAALWWRQRFLVEWSWFWGMAGAAPSLITPSPGGPFPDWLFFQYFVVHGGLVVAPLFLVVGLRLPPRRGAVFGIMALTIVYAAIMAVINWATGLNILFLRSYPPGPPTLLNLLGPWPWYLVGVAAIAVVLFLLFDAPFRFRRGRTPRVQPAP